MKLLLTARARADAMATALWYLDEGGPAVARRFLGAFFRTCRQLADMPRLGRELIAGRMAIRGLRAWPVRDFDKHLIVYQLDEGTLAVLRVVHGSRDLGALFGERPDEVREHAGGFGWASTRS